MCAAETLACPLPLAQPPPHVPANRVVDVDLYRLPGSETDFLAAWKALQTSSTRRLLWTPRNGGHWLVLRGDDVAQIYADHANFSSRITIVPREWGEQYPLRPTTLDPPEHLKYRRVLTKVLSPELVQSAESHIRPLAATAAARLQPRGHCELISEFAADLPLALFARLADIPPAQTNVLPRYAEDPRGEDGLVPVEPIMDRFAAFLRDIVAERRQRPGNDLISVIATSNIDSRPIDEDEACELATAVLTGGLDTVVSTLGLMIRHLAQDTDLRRRLVDDPSQIPAAVAGMLRRFPIMTKARLARHDHEIDGIVIRAGDMVVLPPLSDDSEDALQLGRRKSTYATFGNGVHRCPGATLAQRELEIMLEQWLAHVPDFQLDPTNPPRMQGGVLGAVLTLPLQWHVPADATAST